MNKINMKEMKEYEEQVILVALLSAVVMAVFSSSKSEVSVV